jgi:hypothetical protein
MFPKFNLSRFTVLAALGFSVAVLGGCAETTSGVEPTFPNPIGRVDLARSANEIPLPHGTTTVTPVDSIADTHKIAARHATRFAAEIH